MFSASLLTKKIKIYILCIQVCEPPGPRARPLAETRGRGEQRAAHRDLTPARLLATRPAALTKGAAVASLVNEERR